MLSSSSILTAYLTIHSANCLDGGKACHEVFMDKIVREIMEGCVRGVHMFALK